MGIEHEELLIDEVRMKRPFPPDLRSITAIDGEVGEAIRELLGFKALRERDKRTKKLAIRRTPYLPALLGRK